MDDTPDVERSTPSVWNQEVFVGKIITAANGDEISIKKLPDTIDLSSSHRSTAIGNRCDELIADTLADPKRRERAYAYKVDVEGKRLLMDKNMTVGDETQVNIHGAYVSRVTTIGHRVYTKSEYPIMSIHTHGIADLPASPADMRNMLIDTEDGGLQASIVITPSSRMLFIRTIQTPGCTLTGADGIIKTYEDKVVGEVRDTVRQKQVDYVASAQNLGTVGQDDFARFTKMEVQKISPTVQMRLLAEFCRDNSIAMYMANSDNVYKKVNF